MGQPSRKERRNNMKSRELRLKGLELKQQAKDMAGYVQQLQQQLQMTTITLVSVLAQNGGDYTITKGTMEQVQGNLANLGWKNEPIGESGDIRVNLVEQPSSVSQDINTEMVDNNAQSVATSV